MEHRNNGRIIIYTDRLPIVLIDDPTFGEKPTERIPGEGCNVRTAFGIR